MAEAKIFPGIFGDITFMGLRSAIGIIFIVHGVGKLNEGFLGFLTGAVGFPAEMQVPLALAEIVPGVLLIFGVISRISSSMLAIIGLGAIFHVKHAANLTGQGAYEIDLILLAANLVIITLGPGRVSISHIAKKIPRFLQ